MKKINEINAYIFGHKIGTLIFDGKKIYFEYDKTFKTLGLEISPLKLHTNKTNNIYTNTDNISLYSGLAGVFFDSLPDKHGMAFIDRYFEREGLKPKEVTLLHKLAFIGNRGMGAIEYKPQEHGKSPDMDLVFNAKEAYEQMKNNIKDKNSSIDSLMNIIDSVSPIGGGRPKMLILYNEKTNTIKFNKQKVEKDYKRAIIKFDESFYENKSIGLTKLEYVFMSMAKDVGINTATFKLVEEKGFHHLIIERFDRDENDNKIHMCTASGLAHIDISVAQGSTYETLFSLTNYLCKSQEDIEELFKRMVFNVLGFNFDDHAKNFTYIMNKEGQWSLSPAYDITYSKGSAKQHITTIGGKAKDFNLEDLIKIGKSYAIKSKRVIQIIEKTTEILKTFEVRASIVGINKDEIENCKIDIEKQIKLLEL